jgi:hypothetical protein
MGLKVTPDGAEVLGRGLLVARVGRAALALHFGPVALLLDPPGL